MQVCGGIEVNFINFLVSIAQTVRNLIYLRSLVVRFACFRVSEPGRFQLTEVRFLMSNHGEGWGDLCLSLPVLAVLLVTAFVYYTTVFIVTDQWLSLRTAPGQVPSSYVRDLEDSEAHMHEVKRKVLNRLVT
eukprot:Gb_28808 [translate_table: standard]